MPKGIYKRTKPAWIKGLTKEKDERVEKMSKTKKGVPTRHNSPVSLNIMKKIPKEVLYQRYIIEKKGIPKISKEFSIAKTTVWRYLKFYNIPIIDISGRYFNSGKLKKILTKEVLYKEYILEKKSTIKIAKEFNVGGKTVHTYLRRYGIKIRSISEAKKGKKSSEKTRKKQSLARIGKSPWNKGKELPQFSGENNPNWCGGISFEPYGLEFNNKLKEAIRKRDNYRCQQCFRHQDELFSRSGKKRKLDVHHIDFNKQNSSPNNLISLCLNCHRQTQFNRENWINYFQDRVGGLG